jgi:hypothetical protein
MGVLLQAVALISELRGEGSLLSRRTAPPGGASAVAAIRCDAKKLISVRGALRDRSQAIAVAALALSYASVLHAAVTQNNLNKVGVELQAHLHCP